MQRHDVLFVLAPDIQHGRLILAKRYPRFQIVFCVSDWLGKDGSSESVLCVVRGNQPDDGPRCPWSLM